MRGNQQKQAGQTVAALEVLTRAHAMRESLYSGPRTAREMDWETALADVLADMLHLADKLEADMPELIRRAVNHYQAETAFRCSCGAAFDPDSLPELCPSCGATTARAEVTIDGMELRQLGGDL